MSKINFICPNCEKTLTVERKFVGRKGRCPYCEKRTFIPKPRWKFKFGLSFAVLLSLVVGVVAFYAGSYKNAPMQASLIEPLEPEELTTPFTNDKLLEIQTELDNQEAPAPIKEEESELKE